MRRDWFAAFPEMERHMKPMEGATPQLADDQAPADDEDSAEEAEEARRRRYMACTLTGRWRRGCSFGSALNFVFQGLAADGAKAALWALYRKGFRIVNFIHDEVILEVPLDRLDELTAQAESIMIAEMRKFVPGVAIRTEATAMLRWTKKVKTRKDAQGRLIPWQPDDKTETKESL